jgi:hypothetical protein
VCNILRGYSSTKIEKIYLGGENANRKTFGHGPSGGARNFRWGNSFGQWIDRTDREKSLDIKIIKNNIWFHVSDIYKTLLDETFDPSNLDPVKLSRSKISECKWPLGRCLGSP